MNDDRADALFIENERSQEAGRFLRLCAEIEDALRKKYGKLGNSFMQYLAIIKHDLGDECHRIAVRVSKARAVTASQPGQVPTREVINEAKTLLASITTSTNLEQDMSDKDESWQTDNDKLRGKTVRIGAEIEELLKEVLGAQGSGLLEIAESVKGQLDRKELDALHSLRLKRNNAGHVVKFEPSEKAIGAGEFLVRSLRRRKSVKPSTTSATSAPGSSSGNNRSSSNDFASNRSTGSEDRKSTSQNRSSSSRDRQDQGFTQPIKSKASPTALRFSRQQAIGLIVVVCIGAGIALLRFKPDSANETNVTAIAPTASQPVSIQATANSLRIVTARRTYKVGEAFRFSVASPVPCQLEVHVTDAAGSRDRIVPSFANMDTYPLPGGNRQQPFPDSGGYQITIDDTPGPTEVTATCAAADGTRLSGRADITVVR